MGATEIPILDWRNIREGDISLSPHDPRYFRKWDYTYDPVAKIMILWNPNGAQYGDPFFTLLYWPEMSEERVVQALLDDDPARPCRQSATLVTEGFTSRFGDIDGRGRDAADVLFGHFFGSSIFLGLEDGPNRGIAASHVEGTPGFEFWPEGRSGRGRALTYYLLHAALFELERYAKHQLDLFAIRPKTIAVTVTSGLLAHAGPENFPSREQLSDGAWLVLRKDIDIAG